MLHRRMARQTRLTWRYWKKLYLALRRWATLWSNQPWIRSMVAWPLLRPLHIHFSFTKMIKCLVGSVKYWRLKLALGNFSLYPFIATMEKSISNINQVYNIDDLAPSTMLQMDSCISTALMQNVSWLFHPTRVFKEMCFVKLHRNYLRLEWWAR